MFEHLFVLTDVDFVEFAVVTKVFFFILSDLSSAPENLELLLLCLLPLLLSNVFGGYSNSSINALVVEDGIPNST